MAVPKLVQASVAKAQAILAAKKAAASTAPKTVAPAKTTSIPKAVSTPAKSTVSPGLNIVNQIIAGDITPGTVVTYEPVKQPEPEQPKTVITPEHLSQMQTLTAPSIPQQGYSIKSEPTPQGQLITETKPIIDSSVKAIPETKHEPSLIEKINLIRSPETGGHILSYVFNPERIQMAYNVYSGTGESQEVIEKRNYEQYKELWEKKDVLGVGSRVVQSPIVMVGGSYVLGAGLGGFAATKIGQTAAVTVKGFKITPALALNTATGVYFTTETAKSGYNAYKGGNIKEWLGTTAISLPLVLTPFKEGYVKAGGYVQRKGAMSTVSDPLKRTQQKALYDMMKTNERLHEPYLEQKPYDITNVKTMTPEMQMNLSRLFKSKQAKIISGPAIGGSTAMDIQMGEFFRKGGYPERILSIAEERQLVSGVPKELRTSGQPIDIDVLLGGKLATERSAASLGESLDTHVHVSKPNEPLFGGYSTKPFTKSEVIFSKETPLTKVKTLSVREQFLRYNISALPSAEKQTAYRSFKDIPGLFDTYDVMRFQKGGEKLSMAMDRYMYPERYQSPKVSLGERIIKKIGGAAEPEWIETYKGSYIEPRYPKSYYSSAYMPLSLNRGYGYTKPTYPIAPIKSVDYQPIKQYITKKSIISAPYLQYNESKYSGSPPKTPIDKFSYDVPDIDIPYVSPSKNYPSETPSYVPKTPYIPKTPPYIPEKTTPKEPTYTPPKTTPKRYPPPITPPYIPKTPYKSPPYKPPPVNKPPPKTPEYPIPDESLDIKKILGKKLSYKERYKFRKAKYAKNPFDVKIPKVKI